MGHIHRDEVPLEPAGTCHLSAHENVLLQAPSGIALPGLSFRPNLGVDTDLGPSAPGPQIPCTPDQEENPAEDQDPFANPPHEGSDPYGSQTPAAGDRIARPCGSHRGIDRVPQNDRGSPVVDLASLQTLCYRGDPPSPGIP